jgi:transposase-like protein
MTQQQDEMRAALTQQVLFDEPDFLREIVQVIVQRMLDAEMTAHLGAKPHERSEDRQGYRCGSYPRTLTTRVGKIELQVPRDRDGRFQTQLFARYQRSEKAFVLALMEMYVQGVSTRKVAAITEELCGTEVSKSQVSSLTVGLDAEIAIWRNRALQKRYPYVFVDATWFRARQDGRVHNDAALIAVGVRESGHREVLGVALADSESEASWNDLFRDLRDRGVEDVGLVISDDHRGLVKALGRHFHGASWQRCQVHLMRNLISKVPKSRLGQVTAALKDVFSASGRKEAERRLGVMVDDVNGWDEELAVWLEAHVPDSLTLYDWPSGHHRNIRSTNMLERHHSELKRRTRVVRIFPNRTAALRLISALLMETDEEWTTGRRYLNPDPWKQQEQDERQTEATRAG